MVRNRRLSSIAKKGAASPSENDKKSERQKSMCCPEKRAGYCPNPEDETHGRARRLYQREIPAYEIPAFVFIYHSINDNRKKAVGKI